MPIRRQVNTARAKTRPVLSHLLRGVISLLPAPAPPPPRTYATPHNNPLFSALRSCVVSSTFPCALTSSCCSASTCRPHLAPHLVFSLVFSRIIALSCRLCRSFPFLRSYHPSFRRRHSFSLSLPSPLSLSHSLSLFPFLSPPLSFTLPPSLSLSLESSIMHAYFAPSGIRCACICTWPCAGTVRLHALRAGGVR